MNNSENDRKLKQMMKGIRLESPGPDFSSKVMQAIMVETQKKPSINTEPILGKKFWILVSLFVILGIVFILVFPSGQETGTFKQFFSRIPTPDLSFLRGFFGSAIGKTGSLTWTLMMILLGGSGLVFADRLLDRKKAVSIT